MATAICEGAARNNALSTRNRLISSHSRSPPATDRIPAKYLGCSALPREGAEADSAGRDSGGLPVLTLSLVTLMAKRYALIGYRRATGKPEGRSPRWRNASITLPTFFLDTLPVGSNRFLSWRKP